MLIFALFVQFGVVALFHPSMAFITLHACLASGVLQRFKFLIETPVGTFLRLSYLEIYLIGEVKGISTQVLNVVSINAVGAIMLESIRTPDSFILVHVEVLIASKKMDHLNFYFGLAVQTVFISILIWVSHKNASYNLQCHPNEFW